jgi:hypothetical protein
MPFPVQSNLTIGASTNSIHPSNIRLTCACTGALMTLTGADVDEEVISTILGSIDFTID